MQNTELEKYLSDDTVFNILNKYFITLPLDKVKTNNVYLKEAVETLIEKMKQQDPLFAKVFKQIIFCALFNSTSIYKNTKKRCQSFSSKKRVIGCTKKPAFTTERSNTNNIPSKYILSDAQKKLLWRLFSDDFLDPDKFRQWIEGILSKVIYSLPKHLDSYKLIVKDEYGTCSTFRIKKSGPAFTIILNVPNDEIIHVDLAPVLAFTKDKIDGSTAKLNTIHEYRNKEWYAVPLPLANSNKDFHWRLSFCHQEREILAKHGRVKPVIRLMKKLKDVENWRSMASYFVETLFLNRLTKLQDDLNRIPLTLFFFKMLKELHSACQEHRIEYFWDPGYNLLEKISNKEMSDIANRLKNIIQNIEKRAMQDTFLLATYILDQNELRLLKIEYNKRQIRGTEDNGKENVPPQEQTKCIIL